MNVIQYEETLLDKETNSLFKIYGTELTYMSFKLNNNSFQSGQVKKWFPLSD